LSSLLTREDAATQPFVALNLRDVETSAREAVEQARAEVRRMLSEAVAKAREMEVVAAARGEKAGYDAGFKKGEEAGRQAAFAAEKERIAAATATVREALLGVLTEVENRRHELLAEARQDLVGLAVAIADRICRTQLCRSQDHVRPLVAEVIDLAGKHAGLVLRMNPADAQAAEMFLGEMFGRLNGGAASPAGLETPVCLIEDARVARGGCIGERSGGSVDGRFEAQMERIVAELMGTEKAAEKRPTETV